MICSRICTSFIPAESKSSKAVCQFLELETVVLTESVQLALRVILTVLGLPSL